MKFKISKEWLMKDAEKDDKVVISAGSFNFAMLDNDAAENNDTNQKSVKQLKEKIPRLSAKDKGLSV